jgi:hypothetical protein
VTPERALLIVRRPTRRACVFAALCALRSVDSEEANTGGTNVESVAIDNPRGTGDLRCRNATRLGQHNTPGEYQRTPGQLSGDRRFSIVTGTASTLADRAKATNRPSATGASIADPQEVAAEGDRFARPALLQP